MDASIFLARLLGPALLVMGAGLLVNRDNSGALAREFLDSPALIYLAGLIALALGLALVLTHNVWEFRWPLIITILGWLSLIAGILRIVFPATVMRLGERLIATDGWAPVAGIIYLVLGAWLSFAGFFW